MAKNIVQVDIDKINNEIAAFQREIDLREALKNYAQAISINVDPPKRKAISHGENVTDFVNSFLADGGQFTKDIIEAYAHKRKKSYKAVSNNISNALTRLKADGKVIREKIEGGNGGKWTLVK